MSSVNWSYYGTIIVKCRMSVDLPMEQQYWPVVRQLLILLWNKILICCLSNDLILDNNNDKSSGHIESYLNPFYKKWSLQTVCVRASYERVILSQWELYWHVGKLYCHLWELYCHLWELYCHNESSRMFNIVCSCHLCRAILSLHSKHGESFGVNYVFKGVHGWHILIFYYYYYYYYYYYGF